MRLFKLFAAVMLLASAALVVPAALGAKAKPKAVTAATTVQLQGHQFLPKTVTVHVGDTVIWVNNSGQAHTVTADNGSFDSGNFPSGAPPFQHTFTTAGTFNYYCQYHGGPGLVGMSGTVIVQ